MIDMSPLSGIKGEIHCSFLYDSSFFSSVTSRVVDALGMCAFIQQN